MDRREFLKIVGISTATITAALYGCKSKNEDTIEAGGELGPIPTDKMTYRSFPKLGDDKVSILGYGCMRWPTMPSPDGKGDIIDQDGVNELVDYAIEHGVNYFDTSPVYVQGWSEKATGIALKRHPRESYYIATKLSNFSNPTRENSLAMYYKSFSELDVDYIDYYLLHSIGVGGMENFRRRYVDNGMMDFLMEERKAGKIRHLGWSFHGSKEVFDAMLELHDQYHWDFVQIQMNYIDWRYATKQNKRNTDAEYLYEELAKRNIPVVIMEPLLGGRLANVPDAVVAMMKEHDPEASVASWAFRFTGTYPKVLNVLSGMTRMEHLEDNINTFSPIVPLNDNEQEMLQKAAEIMTTVNNVPCTACQYCMPCPYGVDIPGIFTHHNKCLNEGEIATNSQDDNYKKARRKYLINYDRRVEPLRQANHCIGCGKCVEHCPQNIKIPKELRHIDEYVESMKQGKL